MCAAAQFVVYDRIDLIDRSLPIRAKINQRPGYVETLQHFEHVLIDLSKIR